TAGPIVYNSFIALTVGTVLGTPGITSGGNNVSLGVPGGSLTLNNGVNAGAATVALTVAGPIAQGASGPVTAGSLGVVAAGAVDLCSANAPNNVGTLAATDLATGAPILFGNAVGLVVGSVP